jgi:hypothetical protein
MEHREIELRLRLVKAPTQGFTTFAHAPHRIDLIRNKVAHLMLDHDPHSPPGVSPPDDGGAEILRMQRSDMQAHTQERKAGGIEPPGEFVDRGRTGRNPACRADHPICDAIDAVMGRPFRWWPLDRLGGDDRTAFDNQGFAGRLVVHRLPSWSANLGPVKR